MFERLRILIVDGDRLARAEVSRALAEAEVAADVVEAASAREAIEQLSPAAGDPFDCVLMENDLPDRAGIEVLRQIRSDPSGGGGGGGGGAGVPVVMTAARGNEQLAVEVMKAGAADYLPKALLSPDSLARSVRNAVRLHRAERAAARAADEAREQARAAAALHRIGTRLAGERDLQRLVQLVTDEATALVDAAFGAFFYNIVNEQGEQYMLYTLSGAQRSAYENFPKMRNTEIFAPTFSGSGIVRLDDVTQDPRYGGSAPYHGMPPGHLPVRSYLAVPVIGRSGAVIGGLFFGHCEVARFSARDEEVLAGIASQAAVAIDNARLNEELRRGEQRYRFMSDAVPQLIWTADPTGAADYFNRRWSEYTGLTLEDSAGSGWGAVIHPDDLAETMRRWDESVQAGREYTLEYRLLRDSDKSYRWHLARGVPMRDESGKIVRWFGTCTDIHDQKTAEAQLAAANNAKDQFLAVLSHELRTPLMPVLLTVEALKSDRSVTARMREDLDVIRRNVELEARLIDDLLDLTRVSKGKLQLNFDTVDVHAALRSAMDICAVEIVGKKLGTTMDLAAKRHFVRGDLARLQQVFWNLIKNAVKFTPQGGHITVHTYDDPAGALKVSVTDTGIGIEPGVVGKIFDAFEQADRSVTRQFGGLGLGLAISKALVELHGGELTAQSPGPGQGATFTLALRPTHAELHAPAAPAGSGDDDVDDVDNPAGTEIGLISAKAVAAPSPSSKAVLNILLVDDHRDTSRAMARLLERLGYRVRTADSVSAALSAAEQGGVDLLISDIGLPDGSGLELMRQLLERHPPLKGIALSGFGMEEDVRRSKEAGFYEHLTKPINFTRLETAIRELTGA